MQTRRVTVAACAILAATFISAARTAAAQEQPSSAGKSSAIAGLVRDTAGNPLPMVTVTAIGRDASVVTDSSGRFMLQAPAGDNKFSVMRLGFHAVTFDATLPPDTTVVLTITMHRVAQPLPRVDVTGERMSARLMRDGFYDRRDKGLGKFLSPDDVAQMAPRVMQTSHMLRSMSGVIVKCPAPGYNSPNSPCAVNGTSTCLNIWVDGSLRRNVLLDEIVSPDYAYAFEVYPRKETTPLEFSLPASRCGALVVWTKTRAP